MINIRNNCRKKLIIKKSNKEKFYFYFFVNCNLLKKNILNSEQFKFKNTIYNLNFHSK